MRALRGLFAAACLTTTGCAVSVHSYDVRDVGDVRSQWGSFFLWGAAGTSNVDVPEICGPGGAAAYVGIGHNFGTVILTILTLGIYSPHMAYVSCGTPLAPPAAPPAPAPPPPVAAPAPPVTL